MAAVARIEYGLAEGEFWRLTPRRFHMYAMRHHASEKRRWMPFRFLATITARCASADNKDVDFMKDADEPEEYDPERLRTWLQARALPNGTTISDPDQGPEGTSEGHEADGDGARAEGREADVSAGVDAVARRSAE